MAISVRLNAEDEQRLNELAKKTGRTKTYYVKKLIEEGLSRLEYQYCLQEDLEAYRAGQLKTYSMDEVFSDNDLED